MNEYEEKKMYGNQIAAQGRQAGQILGGNYCSPTLSENIDMRLASLTDQIERLQRVKALLAEPAGILNVPIDDLRYAMNY